MGGSPPSERSDKKYRQRTGAHGGRLAAVQQPGAPGAHWLAEFLRREGIAEPGGILGKDSSPEEPAKKPGKKRGHGTPLFIGVGALVAVGVAGAVVYHHLTAGQQPRQAPPAVVAQNVPMPAQAPNHPQQTAASGGATDYSDFPHQPVRPPPPALSNWSTEPGPSNPPIIRPPITQPRVPAPVAALRAKAPPPKRQTSFAFRESGSGLHLQIIYPPSGPAGASRIDGLISGLRSQVGGIASATATTGAAEQQIVVVYFSPADHAAARRVAASVCQTMRRHYELRAGHEDPPPPPGTLKILLPE